MEGQGPPAWRQVLAIARHEVGRSSGGMKPRTLAFVAAGIAVGAALLAPLTPHLQPDPDAGLYRISVDDGSPLLPVVLDDPALTRTSPADADVRIFGVDIAYDAQDERGVAAYATLRLAVIDHLDASLAQETDAAAAFPLTVTVRYGQPAAPPAPAGPTSTATQTATSGPTSTGTAGPTSPTPPGPTTDPGEDGLPEPAAQSIRPADIEPPFPARSLLLTFAYLVPMNFIAQVYAGALQSERTLSRGRTLLSTPVGHGAILLGRSLPYIGLGALVLVGVTTWLDAGLAGLAAAATLVAFVLAASMFAGLTARSPRELTFLLVAVTTGLSTFLFLPAMFPGLPPVAFLSPISVITAGIRGETVGWGPFLYATLPLALATVALVGMGVALFRDRALFATRSLSAHILDAVAQRTRTLPAWAVAGFFAVPFAVALQVFVIGVSLPLGLAAAVPAFVLGTAFVEELLKGLPAMGNAGKIRRPVVAGALLGAGFFVGEKTALILGLVGFPELPSGGLVLASLGVGGWLVLLAPLGLHAATGALTAVMTQRWPMHRAWMWMPAACVHVAYNGLLILGALQ